MRILVAAMAAAALLVIGSPAGAGTVDLVRGVNNVLTSPLEVTDGLVDGYRVYDVGQLHPKLAVVNVVTDRVSGVAVGLGKALRRGFTGFVDVLIFPVTAQLAGPVSPDPKYLVVVPAPAPE